MLQRTAQQYERSYLVQSQVQFSAIEKMQVRKQSQGKASLDGLWVGVFRNNTYPDAQIESPLTTNPLAAPLPSSSTKKNTLPVLRLEGCAVSEGRDRLLIAWCVSW